MYTLHTHAKLVQKKSLSLLGANNNILTFLREQFQTQTNFPVAHSSLQFFEDEISLCPTKAFFKPRTKRIVI